MNSTPVSSTAVGPGAALRNARSRLETMLADLETLVCCESPSSDWEGRVRCDDLLTDLVTRHGLPVTRLTDDAGGPVLLVGTARPRVLLLGHLDTVHPLGTLADVPFRVLDGRVSGPGVLDMKAGLVQAVHAMTLAGSDDVGLLVTSDEEVGSVASRHLIEGHADAAAAVLVLEASRGGALKTERKGVSRYLLRLHGRASHAGLDPQAGANATVALARAVLAAAALADPAAGTSVTPTVASSGTSTNTVPDLATLAVDVRAGSATEQQRVDSGMRTLGELEPEVTIELKGGINRLPMPEEASRGLFDRACVAAAKLNLPTPRRSAVGGGSDGNLTAARGMPTLDGLGAVGEGPHTREEWADVSEIPARTALVACLLTDPSLRTLPRLGERP